MEARRRTGRAFLASFVLAAVAAQAFVAVVVESRASPAEKASQGEDVKKPDCVPGMDPRSFPGIGGAGGGIVPLTPPSHGGGSGSTGTPSHGGGFVPTPSHGGATLPTPSHGGGGIGSSPTSPSTGGGGGSPSHGGFGSTPTSPSTGGSPSHGGGGFGSSPTAPSTGSSPSHGGGFGSSPTAPSTGGSPSHGGFGSSPTAPSTPGGGGAYGGSSPSPSTPGGGGAYGGGSPSPTSPAHGGGGGGAYGSSQTTPAYGGASPSHGGAGIGTSSPTPFVVPMDPHTFGSLPGSCDYWRSHPMEIWSAIGGRFPSTPSPSTGTPTMGHFFGAAGRVGGSSDVSIEDALGNTRADATGALLREGAAALLNSMTRSGFPYTTDQVRDAFVAAAAADDDGAAAAAQAAAFRKANEGKA